MTLDFAFWHAYFVIEHQNAPETFGRQAGLGPESRSAELLPTDAAQDRGRQLIAAPIAPV